MVIDSTIFIEYLRAKDRSKTTLTQLQKPPLCYISDVTVFELFMGATDAKKWHEVEVVLDPMLRLPFNQTIAVEAAKIYQHLRSQGMMIEFRDIFIAATARFHDLPVKTLNTKDFARIPGIRLA